MQRYIICTCTYVYTTLHHNDHIMLIIVLIPMQMVRNRASGVLQLTGGKRLICLVN